MTNWTDKEKGGWDRDISETLGDVPSCWLTRPARLRLDRVMHSTVRLCGKCTRGIPMNNVLFIKFVWQHAATRYSHAPLHLPTLLAHQRKCTVYILSSACACAFSLFVVISRCLDSQYNDGGSSHFPTNSDRRTRSASCSWHDCVTTTRVSR